MNAFSPENPKVVILVQDGSVEAVGNNIDPKLYVNVTNDPTYFEVAIKGIPFDSRTPEVTSQVLSHKK